MRFSGLRGNIATRLTRVGEFDAIVMAKAALDRLGLTPDVVDVLDVTVMLPQVGQGALAIECRSFDHARREILAGIDHRVSRRTVETERSFLAELGGDCDLPAGAYATIDIDDGVMARGLLASRDGATVLYETTHGRDPHEVGRALARALVARGGPSLGRS